MANADTPCGFVPLRHRGGGVIRANKYEFASAYGTALYTGDAVILSSGDVAIAAQDSATILGIFAGCQYRASDGSMVFSPYWPASTVTLGSERVTAFVFDDPMISYRVQTETSSTYVKATHDGSAYDIELDHAGSAFTGQSGMELDLTDTGTGQFIVLGLIDEPGNAVGVNAKLEVMVKESLLKGN